MTRPTASRTPGLPAQGRPRLLALVPALVLLGTALPLAAGQIYQWKDANGVTHYSDSPPPTQDYQNRNVDASVPPPASAADAKPPVENTACADARANLEMLAGDREVGLDTDGDGKVDSTLDAAQRADQKQLAEAAIRVHCKG